MEALQRGANHLYPDIKTVTATMRFLRGRGHRVVESSDQPGEWFRLFAIGEAETPTTVCQLTADGLSVGGTLPPKQT